MTAPRRPHAFLLTVLLCLAAAAVDCILVLTLAQSSSSFSDKWLTLCGLLIIFAAVGGYYLFDGRKPSSRSDRLLYSGACAAVSGAASWAMSTLASRAWEAKALAFVKSGGASFTQGALEQAAIGVAAGFLVCYYGMTRLDAD